MENNTLITYTYLSTVVPAVRKFGGYMYALVRAINFYNLRYQTLMFNQSKPSCIFHTSTAKVLELHT
jgi:hypothetical protein